MKKQYKVGDLVEYSPDIKWYKPELGLLTEVIEKAGGKILLVVQYKDYESGHLVKSLDEVPHLAIIN